MALQPIKAKRVSSLGESPAEARRRMATAPQGRGEEVPTLTPTHMAAIRAADEGFSAPPLGGTVEDAPELTEPPTPSKAMAMIQQLSQDKLQLQAERDSALQLVERYKTTFGEVD